MGKSGIKMNTIIEYTSEDNDLEKNSHIIEEAARILEAGGLVAFPTETVYGLGADFLNEAAVKNIYAAKGRPSDNPLIVHIADKKAIYELAVDVSDNAKKLAEKFWPGPLTMIMKKSGIVPGYITGGLDTVAVRMPDNAVALELIGKSGVYVAAPSANLSGKPSTTTAEHVINDLNGRIDMIIADKEARVGIESTIVDVSGEIPIILRPGAITKEMLEEQLGRVDVDPAVAGAVVADGVVPRAPGMKYKHYAPNADMTIVEGSNRDVIDTINRLAAEKMQAGFKVGIVATADNQGFYKADVVLSLGHNEAEAASKLYAVLRTFDKMEVDYIYSESFKSSNVGTAIMNRLIKAAGHNIIKARGSE